MTGVQTCALPIYDLISSNIELRKLYFSKDYFGAMRFLVKNPVAIPLLISKFFSLGKRIKHDLYKGKV